MADLGTPGVSRELGAVLLLQSAMMTLDAYSTFQSSPWTAESFGADENKAKSAREYLRHAVGFSMIYAGASAYMARSWWPVAGALVTNGYLVWLYERALGRAVDTGSDGWGQSRTPGGASTALSWDNPG
jgi:hypothetical protein